MEMNQNPTIQDAAQVAADKGDHYLRVKTEGVNPLTGHTIRRTVLLQVMATGNVLLGREVTMREGDIGLGIYDVIRNGSEQQSLISWDAIIWAKVIYFNWDEGTLNTIMEAK